MLIIVQVLKIHKEKIILRLAGVLSALKNFLFSRKPFEWVPCFPFRVFISSTSITSTFENFSLQLFLRETLNGRSSRPLSPIISEPSVLRFSVMDSGGEITVVTRGDPCAFHCLEIFHFVEMQPVICLYFHTALQTF